MTSASSMPTSPAASGGSSGRAGSRVTVTISKQHSMWVSTAAAIGTPSWSVCCVNEEGVGGAWHAARVCAEPTEFVLHDRNLLAVVLCQDAVDQRCLACRAARGLSLDCAWHWTARTGWPGAHCNRAGHAPGMGTDYQLCSHSHLLFDLPDPRKPVITDTGTLLLPSMFARLFNSDAERRGVGLLRA